MAETFAQGNQSITTGTGQLARQHSFDGAFELLRLSKATQRKATRGYCNQADIDWYDQRDLPAR